MEATPPRNFPVRSKSRSGLNLRSIASAPIALRFREMGTHTKLSSCSGRSGRLDARCSSIGSLLARGTTTGRPVSTTRPGMPSPIRYFTGAPGLSRPSPDPAHRTVMAGEDLEDVVHGGLEVQGPRQRLTDFQQRREAADLGRLVFAR